MDRGECLVELEVLAGENVEFGEELPGQAGGGAAADVAGEGDHQAEDDHEPFGDKGVFLSSGVVERQPDGSLLMNADAQRSDGKRFSWTAALVLDLLDLSGPPHSTAN